MQPNIAMKFAGYVAWILLYKHCKFGKKNHYSSRDIEFIEFYLGDYFFGVPCIHVFVDGEMIPLISVFLLKVLFLFDTLACSGTELVLENVTKI